jgi:hypothetical protein
MTLALSETTITMNATARYPYSYDRAGRTGAVLTLGVFTVSEDYLRLTFPQFMGGGSAVFDNSAAAIIGPSWFWGQCVVRFGMALATINGVGHSYAYDGAAKTGTIEKIGAFSLAEDGIAIREWRRSRFDVLLRRQSGGPPVWNGSLVGTAWGWTNPFNGLMIFEFMTEGACILTFTESAYHDDAPEEYAYAYEASSNAGTIPTQGAFSVGEDNAYLFFAQWQSYPHGAVFNRMK